MAPPAKPLILYAVLPSGNSQKAVLMLHLLDIPFELRAPEGLVGPTAEAKQAPFLRLNPLGQVPVLVDPNMEPEPAVGHGGNAGEPHCAEGLVIRESAAILTYVAAKYAPQGSSWLPGADDPVRAARCAQWLAYAGSEVNNALLKVRVSVLFGWDISPLTVDLALEASKKVLAYLDSQFAAGTAAGRDWLVEGPAPTVADVALFPYVAWAEDSSKGQLSLSEYPAVSAWLAKFKALSGYVAPPGL